MTTIQVDEMTARALEAQAKSAGMTVEEYVRKLLPQGEPPTRAAWDDIEQAILALSSDGPSLPVDFSRADIYREHD